MELKVSKLPDEKVTCYNCVHCVHCHTLFPSASFKECVYTPCQFKPDGDIFYEDCFFMSRDNNMHICTHSNDSDDKKHSKSDNERIRPCVTFKSNSVNIYGQRFMCVGCPHFISWQEAGNVIYEYMRTKTESGKE